MERGDSSLELMEVTWLSLAGITMHLGDHKVF